MSDRPASTAGRGCRLLAICLANGMLVAASVTALAAPRDAENLAFVGNGAKPATCTPARPEPHHDPARINDGAYGDDSSWTAPANDTSFVIELARPAKIGRFTLGRDRTGVRGDRAVLEALIETSADGRAWQTVFDGKNIHKTPGFDPQDSTEILIRPVEAALVRVTVRRGGNCLDEFEVFTPAADAPADLPAVRCHAKPAERTIVLEKRYLNLPVGGQGRRLAIEVDGRNVHEFDISLAPGRPDFWSFIDVGAWRGKTATLKIARTMDPAILDRIEQADTVKEADTIYKEPLRPQFHFSQKRGWNNDPNGMCYHDGEWHLFWQHNPFGCQWANMYWGHAVSRDLVHWEELNEALRPWTMAKEHCFSGSAAVDVDNTAGFRTGTEPVMVAAFTDTGVGEAIAYSNDRGRTWTYWEGNPVVRHSGRDPKIFWYAPGKHWVMAVYDTSGGNNVSIFNSSDLKKWDLQSRVPGYFECPELFEIPVAGDKTNTRWVIFAADAKYAVGRFDGRTFTPEHEGKHQLHHGAYYASQLFTGAPEGRRIQIGWGRFDLPGMPFNQTFTFPAELTLRTTADGLRMFAEPVREIEGLRDAGARRRDLPVAADAPVEVPVKGRLLDVRAEFEPGSAKTVVLDLLGRQVTYDVAGEKLDGVEMKPVSGRVRVRVLVDTSIVEVFGNDGLIHITSPARTNQAALAVRVRADGGTARLVSLEIDEIRSIWAGR